jgi:transcriptional regulator with XRE-family HTH domain
MDTKEISNTPNPAENLAEYVRRLRSSLDMSQQELATKAGLHLQSIGKIERGKTNKLNAKAKRGLAYALSIPIEYLDAVGKGVGVTPIEVLKICPKCWTAGCEPEQMWLNQRSNFCFLCGSELRDRCPSCQTPISSYSHRFCPFCGTNYKQIASAEEWKARLAATRNEQTQTEE